MNSNPPTPLSTLTAFESASASAYALATWKTPRHGKLRDMENTGSVSEIISF
jgi:hypothetical protein